MDKESRAKGWRRPKPSRATRKIRKVSTASFVGQTTFGEDTGQGRCVVFESKTELDSLLMMIYAPGVVDVEEQIAPVRYLGADGKEHVHHFDFRVTLIGGKRTAAAVKNPRVANTARFRDQMHRVAAAAIPTAAEKVVVISDRNLDPARLERVSLFHACRFPQPEIDERLARHVDGMVEDAVLRDLLNDAGLGDVGFHAAVRLIRHNVLTVPEDVRITLSCVVSKGGARNE